MQLSNHSLPELFGQLGLPSDDQSIETFIKTHRPISAGSAVADAPFWTPAQAQFLRDEILEDADWAPIVDQLGVLLSHEGSEPR